DTRFSRDWSSDVCSSDLPVRKILLKGYFGFANLGDDLLLVTAYSLLREAFPTAAIDVFSNNTIDNTSVGNRVIGSEYLAHLLNRSEERSVGEKSSCVIAY